MLIIVIESTNRIWWMKNVAFTVAIFNTYKYLFKKQTPLLSLFSRKKHVALHHALLTRNGKRNELLRPKLTATAVRSFMQRNISVLMVLFLTKRSLVETGTRLTKFFSVILSNFFLLRHV